MSEAGSSEVARRKLFDEDSMFDSSEGFMEEEDQVFYGGAWETMRDHAFSRATWDAEKLSRYDENARKDIQKFFKDYKTRYRDADVDPELYTPYNNPEPLWNFEKLESPKLSYKDKKKKKGEMKAAMKRAKEREAFERSGQPFPNQGYLTNASEYSAYMKEVAERKIAPVPDYSRLYEDGFTAETDEYTYEDGTHALTFKKEDLYEKNYSPDMFDPTYFAENFASVMDEMQKLRDLVKFFSDDANAQDLSVFDTERLRVLTETLKLMEDCYDKALAVHSLVRNEEGRIGFRLIEPEQTKEELAKAQEALRKYALSEDDAITAKIEKRYIESMSTHFEQETKDMQDRYQEKITKTSVAEPFFAEETYRTLDRIVKATEMEENAERYGKNSHTIETTLNQYLDEANAMSVYERMGASCEKMLEELKKANGGSLDGLSPEDAAYLNVILRKQKSIEYELKLYKSHLAELEKALDFLILGKEEEATEKTHMILLGHYHTEDYDKQEKASQQASLYEDRVHDTNELLIAFMEEKYPFQSTVTQILTDILKYDPLRFLLDSENQSANERIFTLMVCLNKDRILKALPDFDIDALIKAEYKKSKKDGDDDDITLDDMLRNAFVDITITDYVTPRLRDFERFNARNKDALKALDNPSKDHLLRMQPDLMELYITGAMLTRLATVKSGSTFGGGDKLNPTLAQKIGRTLSVRDTLSSDEFLVPKQQIFEGLFMQSRAAAILSVDAHDAWNAMNEFLTEDERKMLEADKTLETDVERIYAFAEDLMVRGKQLQAAAKQRLIDEIKASDERKSKQQAGIF